MANFVDIPWDNVSIIYMYKLMISDNLDCELFLSHLFDFTKVVVLDDIVDCVDCEAERKVCQGIDVELLDDPHAEDKVLKQEERLSHYLEHLRKVAWDLDFVLVPSKERQSFHPFFSR